VSSESTEYSDWEPDGVNLQPPKRRSLRHIKRRRWSSLEASESSDAEADEQRHGDDKRKAKVKVESDDEETGKKSLKKRSSTRNRKKVTAGKQKKQVFLPQIYLLTYLCHVCILRLQIFCAVVLIRVMR